MIDRHWLNFQKEKANEGDLDENIAIYGKPDYGHLKSKQSWGHCA